MECFAARLEAVNGAAGQRTEERESKISEYVSATDDVALHSTSVRRAATVGGLFKYAHLLAYIFGQLNSFRDGRDERSGSKRRQMQTKALGYIEN